MSQEVCEFLDRAHIGPIYNRTASPLLCEDPRIRQDPQMIRERAVRDVKLAGDFAGNDPVSPSIRHRLESAQPALHGERREHLEGLVVLHSLFNS